MAEGSRVFLGVLSIWFMAMAVGQMFAWLFP